MAHISEIPQWTTTIENTECRKGRNEVDVETMLAESVVVKNYDTDTEYILPM